MHLFQDERNELLLTKLSLTFVSLYRRTETNLTYLCSHCAVVMWRPPVRPFVCPVQAGNSKTKETQKNQNWRRRCPRHQ